MHYDSIHKIQIVQFYYIDAHSSKRSQNFIKKNRFIDITENTLGVINPE
jgi:hypothetical protein